jgi:hypothetical protein
MRLREALRLVASLLLSASLLQPPLTAKTQPVAALDVRYVSALAAADRLLQAWQAGDVENGMALLTSGAKEKVTAEVLDGFFSNPGPSAYEIDRGKLLRPGRYEFPVVFLSGATKNVHAHRRFSSIIVVNTGHSDWAVDKLP